MNCTADPRSGNVLTSPEFTLSSSRELTFTMTSVDNFFDYSPVHVYQTSTFGRIDTLLGSYSLELGLNTLASDSNNTDNYTLSHGDIYSSNYTVCLPAGTYQLVFVASEIRNVSQSFAAITKILLTDSSCTYTSLAGLSRQ